MDPCQRNVMLMNSLIRDKKVGRNIGLKIFLSEKLRIRVKKCQQGHQDNHLAASSFRPVMNKQNPGFRAVMHVSDVALLTRVRFSGRGSRTLWAKLRSFMNSGKMCGV